LHNYTSWGKNTDCAVIA